MTSAQTELASDKLHGKTGNCQSYSCAAYSLHCHFTSSKQLVTCFLSHKTTSCVFAKKQCLDIVVELDGIVHNRQPLTCSTCWWEGKGRICPLWHMYFFPFEGLCQSIMEPDSFGLHLVAPGTTMVPSAPSIIWTAWPSSEALTANLSSLCSLAIW